MVEMPDHKFFPVYHCASCDHDHKSVEFHAFIGQPIQRADGNVWNYYGYCPITGDPIMMQVKDGQDKPYHPPTAPQFPSERK